MQVGPKSTNMASFQPVGGKKKVNQKRHHCIVSGTNFVLDTFYLPIKQVGSGAYGVVWYVRCDGGAKRAFQRGARQRLH